MGRIKIAFQWIIKYIVFKIKYRKWIEIAVNETKHKYTKHQNAQRNTRTHVGTDQHHFDIKR